MKILKEMILHPRENAILWLGLIVLLIALYVIFSSDAGVWRWLYCNGEQHAIECAVKGWY